MPESTATVLICLPRELMARVVRARMPPSPSWSARITKIRYLHEMMISSDHRMSEIVPRALASLSVSLSPAASNDSRKA